MTEHTTQLADKQLQERGDGGGARRGGRRSSVFRWIPPENAALLVILIALIVGFAFATPNFLNTDNFLNILNGFAVAGIISIPGTMLLVSGNLDLSVGTGAALCGVVFAYFAAADGVWAGIVITLVVGGALGLLNGFLTSVVGVTAFIATLGTMAIFGGAAEIVANGQTLSVANFDGLSSRLGGIVPLPVLYFLLLAVVGYLVMRFTVFGRSLYTIGSNRVAARLVGVRIRLTVMVTFIASGLAVAIAGLVLSSQLGAASPTAAVGIELSVVTAVVLGGASLHGGRGTIGGTLLALLVIGVLDDGMTLLNVSSFWQDIANGALLIAAVSFDQVRTRLGAKQRGSGKSGQ